MMKRAFLLIIVYSLFPTISILSKEATSVKIRVAILDFQDKGSQKSPQTKLRVRGIFEDIFSKMGAMMIEKDLIDTVQSSIEEVTQGIAKILGGVIEADLVVMGDYKALEDALYINSYFINTDRKEIEGIDEQIIHRIKEMGIKRFDIRRDREVFLNISMVIEEEKKEEEIQQGLEKASLFITSTPGNAKIYINGKLIGVTPQSFMDILPSVYRIRLVKNGLEKEETIILKNGDRIRLDIDLYNRKANLHFPIFEKEYPVKLFVIETPYLVSKGKYHVSIDYPELLILRYGILKDGLEARLQGLGIGIKYKWKGIGFSLLYKTRNAREGKKENTLDIDSLFIQSLDTPLGIFDLYDGLGYRFLNVEGIRYFVGLETYIFQDLRLIMEYSSYEGWAIGFRYPLPYMLKLSAGIGLTNKGEFRWDGNISYSN